MEEIKKEEIKVTKEIFTSAVFVWGDLESGKRYIGGSQSVVNKDLQNLEHNPGIIHIFFGDDYILTDETGQKYVSNKQEYDAGKGSVSNKRVFDAVSPTIYCGKGIPTEKALYMFPPGTWQYRVIETCIKDGIERVSISATGFVEGMSQNGLTLEEYVSSYSITQDHSL